MTTRQNGVQAATRWTHEAILAAMQTWHDAHGKVPSTVDWARPNGSRPTTSMVLQVFPTWNTAVRLAGFTPRRPVRNYTRSWTEAELVEIVRANSPDGSLRPFDEWPVASPSRDLLRTRFGSWAKVAKAAGLLTRPEVRTLRRQEQTAQLRGLREQRHTTRMKSRRASERARAGHFKARLQMEKRWVVECACGWATTAPTGVEAQALLIQHVRQAADVISHGVSA